MRVLMRTCLIVATLCTVALGQTTTQPAQARDPNTGQAFAIKPTTRAVLVGPVPTTQSLERMAISENCHTLAMTVADLAARKMVLTLNGKTIATGDTFPQIALSPDGKRLAYFESDSGAAFISIDGVRDTHFDRIANDDKPALAFSPDSKRVAFIAATAAGWTVVLDGKPGAIFATQPSRLTFSPDSQHLAFVDTSDKQQAVVLDGRRGDGYAMVKDLCFSRAGGHIAYAAESGERGQWAAIVDGAPGAPYADVDGLCFNADGTRYAYRAMESQSPPQWRAIIDGKPGAVHYEIAAGPIFSDAKNHVAYSAYDTTLGPTWALGIVPPERSFLVADGAVSEVPYVAREVVYSPDGNHRAIEQQIGFYSRAMIFSGPNWPVYVWHYRLDVDGVTLDTSDAAYDGTPLFWSSSMAGITFCESGARLAFAATWDPYRWTVFHAANTRSLEKDYDNVTPPQFDSSGSHIAYAGRAYKGTRWEMVLDDNPVQGYEPIRALLDGGLSGSQDALRPSGKDAAVFQISQVPYHFDPDGTLNFFGAEDGKIYWVQVKPDQASTVPTTRP